MSRAASIVETRRERGLTPGPLVVLVLAPCVMLGPVFAGRVLVPAAYQTSLLPWGEWSTDRGLSWNPLMLDSVLQYYPWRDFAARTLRDGEVPLWNPYQLCGLPFLANGQSAVLYPPNVIFWILPVRYAFGIAAILHLILAGALTFALGVRAFGLSRWAACLSGLAFQLSGFVVSWVAMTAAMNTIVWIPAVLLAVWMLHSRSDLASAVWLGLAVAMIVLAGHLQFAFYGIATGIAYLGFLCAGRDAANRRTIARVLSLAGVGLALGVALAAAQLLPTLELGAVNHRPASRSAGDLTFLHHWALNGTTAASLFTMAPYGNPSRGTWLLYPQKYPQNYAEICGVVGCVTVLLAAMGAVFGTGRGRWFLVGLVAIALVAAFGTPLATALYWCLPGFSRFAGLPRVLCLWSLGMALLAGVGYDVAAKGVSPLSPALPPRSGGGDNRHGISRLVLGTAAVVAVLVALCASRTSQLMSGAAQVVARDLLPFCLLLIVSTVAVLYTGCVEPARKPWLLVILAAELLRGGFGYTPDAPSGSVYAASPAIEALRQCAHGGRVLTLTRGWQFTEPGEAALPPNAATVFGLRDLQGYDSLMPRWAKHGAAVAGGEPCPLINGNMAMVGERSLDGLRPDLLAERGLAAVIAGRNTAVDLVKRGGFTAVSAQRNTVVLVPDVPPKPIPEHDGPNRMIIAPGPPADAGLVRETYSPGWRVRDESGRELATTLDETTGFIRLPSAPESRLRASYEPASFAVGLFVSLVGVAGVAGGLGWTLSRRDGGGARA